MAAPTVGFTVRLQCVDMAPDGEPPELWAILDRMKPEQDGDGMTMLTLARGTQRQIIWATPEFMDTVKDQPDGEFHWTGWFSRKGD